ncbi:MAG: GyrI-like domain-containing protein, partial [Acidimicrobiia bacterium]|nr:GyrI-like domain-containing protein [Acidimicrobiia bacterium]
MIAKLDVRIVHLGPLHVVAATGYGEHPEDEAWEIILAFAREHGLEPWSGRHRFFGFNHPSPPECPPEPGSEYGYEQWMTVDGSVDVEAPLELKEVVGGQYAVTHCTGLENISGMWRELADWVTDHGYEWAPGVIEGLEEVLTPIDTPLDEWEI